MLLVPVAGVPTVCDAPLISSTCTEIRVESLPVTVTVLLDPLLTAENTVIRIRGSTPDEYGASATSVQTNPVLSEIVGLTGIEVLREQPTQANSIAPADPEKLPVVTVVEAAPEPISLLGAESAIVYALPAVSENVLTVNDCPAVSETLSTIMSAPDVPTVPCACTVVPSLA